MSITKKTTTILLAISISTIFVCGCNPQLPQNEDAILYYFRNARLLHARTGKAEGKVRRVWNEGQDYANSVLKADAALLNEFKPLRDRCNINSLWEKEDYRWQSADELNAEIEALSSAISSVEAKEKDLFKKLTEAICKTPEGLVFADDSAKTAFIEKVWKALEIHGQALKDGIITSQWKQTAAVQLELFQKAKEHFAALKPNSSGLDFEDKGVQKEIIDLHLAIQKKLRDQQTKFISYIETTLKDTCVALQNCTKDSDRNRYEHLSSLNAYLKNEILDIPKYLRTQASNQKEIVEGLKKEFEKASAEDRTSLQAKIDFLENRIKTLEAAVIKWQTKSTEILQSEQETNDSQKSD